MTFSSDCDVYSVLQMNIHELSSLSCTLRGEARQGVVVAPDREGSCRMVALSPQKKGPCTLHEPFYGVVVSVSQAGQPVHTTTVWCLQAQAGLCVL